MAERIVDCSPIYVEKGTIYGPFVLYGTVDTDTGASGRAIQSDLYSDCPSSMADDFPFWSCINGLADEYGAIISQKKLDLEFWSLVLFIL